MGITGMWVNDFTITHEVINKACDLISALRTNDEQTRTKCWMRNILRSNTVAGDYFAGIRVVGSLMQVLSEKLYCKLKVDIPGDTCSDTRTKVTDVINIFACIGPGGVLFGVGVLNGTCICAFSCIVSVLRSKRM